MDIRIGRGVPEVVKSKFFLIVLAGLVDHETKLLYDHYDSITTKI